MEEGMKPLFQELGDAIDARIHDSNHISAVLDKIKEAGYDVFLVIDATIAFRKREDGSIGGDISYDPFAAPPTPAQPTTSPSDGKIKLTSRDRKFLRALKVAVDKEDMRDTK